MRRAWLIAVCLIGLLAGPVLAFAQSTVEVRVSANPEDEAWVGERVSIFVEVLTPSGATGSPRFDVPELDTAILYRLPGSPTLGSEQIDGTEFVSRRYRFVLYPRRAGTLEVPPIGVRVPVQGDDPSEVRVSTPSALAFDIRQPPGTAPESAVVTSPDFSVTQTWSATDGAGLRVGDAIERTVSATARDVIGIAIPPAWRGEVPGTRVYPSRPQVDDQINRGQIGGARTDTVTYICTAEGTIEFPALVYTWWDPQAEQLRTQTLPGISVDVSPALGGGATSVEAESAVPPGDPQQTLVLTVAGVLAVTALSIAGYQMHQKRKATAVRSVPDPRPHFRACLRACAANDPIATHRALTRWRAALGGAAPGVPRTLVQELELAVLHPERAWSGRGLSNALRHVSRRPDPGDVPALPPLNP